MSFKRSAALGLVTLAAVVFVAGNALAAVIGTDNASAAAYDDGWTEGDDGFITGDGAFGQWFMPGDSATHGHEIGDSTQVAGGSGANINSSGKSFRMWAHNGDYTDAYRFLDPDGLSMGQTFSLDLAVNFRGGFKGMDLRGASGGDPTIFNFNIGGDDYNVANAATGNGSIGNAYSNNTAFHLSFTQTSLAGGTWSITRTGGVNDFDTGTYLGVARSIKLYIGGQGSAPEDDLYVNNLSIIPEPSCLALIGMGCSTLAFWRRK